MTLALALDAPPRPLRTARTDPAPFEADRRWQHLQQEVFPHVCTIHQDPAGRWSATCSTCTAASGPHQLLSAAIGELLDQGEPR